jgi:predicted ester cyclase
MKRLSFLTLATIVFACMSCNDKAGTETTTNGPTGKQKEMIDANRQVQHAIETGDTAILAKYIGDDAVDHAGGPNGSDLKGPEIRKMLGSIHNDIDNLKIEVQQEAANDDHIFCLSTMTGTTNKAVWGMPKGHKMNSKSVDVIKVKDGKMVDHWGFYEMAEMMAMMNSAKPADGTTMPAADTTHK